MLQKPFFPLNFRGEYDKLVDGSYVGGCAARGEKGLSKITKVVWQWLLAVILLAIVIYYWGLSDVLKVSVVSWPAAGLALVCTISFTLIHNVRWLNLLKTLLSGSGRKEMDFFQYYQWLMNSYALGLFVPSDVSLAGVRTFFMKEYGDVRTATAFLSVLLDRVFDVIVLIIFIVSAFVFFLRENSPSAWIVPLVMITVTYVVLLWKNDEFFAGLLRIYFWAVNFVLQMPILRRWKRPKSIAALPCVTMSRGTMCGIMTWSLVKYGFIALRFYSVGLAFGVGFAFLDALFAAAIVQVAGLINVTPGGLGVIEIGSYGALKVVGASHPEAVVFVVGQRIMVSCIIVVIAVFINLFIVARAGRTKQGFLPQ